MTRWIAAWALAMGAASPAVAQELGSPYSGTYLAEDGEWLQLEDVYRRHFSLGEPQPLRSLAWQVGILTIGTAWYWLEADANAADWDYPNLVDRVTLDAIRFDNNHYTINHLSHPMAGGAYYLGARVHNYGVLGSSITSILTSAAWEVLLEFREKISVNDSIFTPGAGIAMGEAYYRLSHYLNSAPGGGTWIHKSLAWLIGWPVALNRWADGVEPVDDGLADNLGFSAAYTHRFRLAAHTAYEEDVFGDPGFLRGFRLEGELIAVPGFQRPGKTTLIFDDGNFTSFDATLAFDHKGEGAHLELWFDSALYGYYEQNYEGPADAISGSASRMSISFSFEHVQRWLPRPRDRRAVLHLPGANFAIWLAFRGLVGSFELALHPDFAAIDSLGFPFWQPTHTDRVVRSVLSRRGYYFGWGGSTWAKAALEYKGLRLDGKVRFGYVNSVEGIDRDQEKVDFEGNLEDTLVEYRASLGYTIPDYLLSFRLEFQRMERGGSFGGSSGEREWNHYAGTAGIEF